jgi:hypothetical protein
VPNCGNLSPYRHPKASQGPTIPGSSSIISAKLTARSTTTANYAPQHSRNWQIASNSGTVCSIPWANEWTLDSEGDISCVACHAQNFLQGYQDFCFPENSRHKAKFGGHLTTRLATRLATQLIWSGQVRNNRPIIQIK